MPYPVSKLIEGRGMPSIVKPYDSLTKALSIMLENDYSQLPIVDDNEDIKGMITYKMILRSIKNYKARLEDLSVQHACESVETFYFEDDIFDILRSLQEKNAVLITNVDNNLIGIVTNFDTAEYFRNRSEDLMVIEEIELMIRDLLKLPFLDQNGDVNEEQMQHVINETLANLSSFKQDSKALLYTYINLLGRQDVSFSNEKFEESLLKSDKGESIESFEKLTMNELIQMLVHKDCWACYGEAFNIDANFLRNLLEGVRDTRNQLAHFRGELSSDQRDNLQFCRDTFERVNDFLEKALPKDKIDDEIIVGGSIDDDNIAPVGEESTGVISKYSPLAEFLQSIPGEKDKIRLSFEKIENIIDDELPPSAYTQRAWWANDTVGHVQSKHWLDVGWKVGYYNLPNREVAFVRIRERENAYIDFFGPLKTRLNDELDIKLRETNATGTSWLSLISIPESGKQLAQIAIGFSLHSRYRIEVYIDTGEKEINKSIFDKLHTQRMDIESEIGQALGWERLDGKRASRIALYNSGNISDDAEMLKALQDWTVKFFPVVYQAMYNRVCELLP